MKGLGEPSTANAFHVNDQLGKKGRETFASIGCASCHDTSLRAEPELLDWKLAGAKVEGFDDRDNRSPGNETPAKAIDGNIKTKYLNFGAANSGLLVRLPRAAIVTGLTLASANDYDERDPTAYLLEGTNSRTRNGGSCCASTAKIGTTFGCRTAAKALASVRNRSCTEPAAVGR